MRFSPAVVALAIALQSTASAQDEPCGAAPRWLTVTVVETRYLDGETFEVRNRDREVRVGQQIVDRCEIREITTPPDSRPSPGMIEFRRRRPDQPFVLLFVTESPRDICAALTDCAVVE